MRQSFQLPIPQTKREVEIFTVISDFMKEVLQVLDSGALPGEAVYFGSGDGAWRIVRSGNNLVIERYDTDTWVTKNTISAV